MYIWLTLFGTGAQSPLGRGFRRWGEYWGIFVGVRGRMLLSWQCKNSGVKPYDFEIQGDCPLKTGCAHG